VSKLPGRAAAATPDAGSLEAVLDPLARKLSTELGGRTAQAIQRAFGYGTVGELLAHYPRRYASRGELTALSDLAEDESVTLVAEVVDVRERPMRARRGSLLEVIITDGRAQLSLTFFNQPWRAQQLRRGVRGIFAGKVSGYRGARQLAHPDYELFPDDADTPGGAPLDDERARSWAATPIPIYPATSTLASWQIQRAIGVLLDGLPSDLPDPLPEWVRGEHSLLGARDALELVHRPATAADGLRAQETLRWHEALILQVALFRQRAEHRRDPAVERRPGELVASLDSSLPFALTDDQITVGAEIEADLASGIPMNRLVQGEVGSGKTLIALRAMLAVADSGGQSALLAPTEVLAAQHFRSIVATLGPDLAARVRPVLLTGQLAADERRRALLAAAGGGSRIVVGTHALLSERTQFAELGLVVVDEQHRFGVDQREALRSKGHGAHLLVLTATPIPRTVAMTAFGDLDVSTIRSLPAGRVPITSHLVALVEHPGWEPRIWTRLAEEIAQGRQGFVVCPAIDADSLEEGDVLERVEDADDPATPGAPSPAVAAVMPTLEALRKMPVLDTRHFEALHGRLDSIEKDRVMRSFAAGSIDVLVATTVIEVGVDVPNASTMIVLDADRFGMAQLHQLRGRVGRGSVPGLCLLVTRAEPGSVSYERVAAVAATADGFELARIDLELRREGDVLGRAQSGTRSGLKLLRVARDGDLIAAAREAAARLLEDDPDLSEHGALRTALDRRLGEDERAFLAKS